MLTRLLALILLVSSTSAFALVVYSDSGERLSSALCTGSTLEGTGLLDLPGADLVTTILQTVGHRSPEFANTAGRSAYQMQVTYVCRELAGDEFPGVKTRDGARVSLQIGNHLYINVSRFNAMAGGEGQSRLILQAVLTDILQTRIEEKKIVLSPEQVDARAKIAAAKLIGFDRRVREIGVRVRASELPNLLQNNGLTDMPLSSSN